MFQKTVPSNSVRLSAQRPAAPNKRSRIEDQKYWKLDDLQHSATHAATHAAT